MVSVDTPIQLGNDQAKLKGELPEFGDRVPSRQFRKSRTFLNSSKRESKRSKEHKEPEGPGLEVSFGNKSSQKSGVGNLAQKPEPPKKVDPQNREMTLDKVLGSTYQAIDLHSLQDMSNDIFPSRPASRRGRSKHKNFDIMEADEEDENHESVRDLREKLDSTANNLDETVSMNRTAYGGFQGGSEQQRFRATAINTHKTERADTSREKTEPPADTRMEGNRTSYQTRFYPQGKKKATANSQSPRLIREFTNGQGSRRNDDPNGVSPLKTFGNKFNRIPASTIYNQAKTENTYNMTGINFDEAARKTKRKQDKRSQEALNQELFKTQSNIGPEEVSSDRTLMGFRNLEPDKRFAKENRFLNEKKAIEEKFKDEDRQLLEKYGARFGINPDEYFGKQAGQNGLQGKSGAFNGINLNKRISTPFAEPKRYDTFYRSKRFQNGYN